MLSQQVYEAEVFSSLCILIFKKRYKKAEVIAMNAQMRNNLTPQGYIRQMFTETENGEFKVGYENIENDFAEEESTFRVNWTAEDAEKTVQRYNLLTSALTRIGRLHDQLNDEKNREELLSEADLEIYNTYVLSYEPMKVNWSELYPLTPCEPDEIMSLVHEIYERGRYGDLIEEEEMLWKQYCMWNEEQSQKRIPFNRRSCANLIMRAMRYEKLISLDAPEIIVTEEGRCLAEEMVLYYFGDEEPIVWD